MDCPVCKYPMLVLELNNVEIDFCEKCRGIWLDSGELELLLESAEEKDAVLNSFQISKSCPEAPRKCPICFVKMQKVICGKEKEVLIDKCPKGHGLWFDRNELEQIIEDAVLDQGSKTLSLLRDMFGG